MPTTAHAVGSGDAKPLVLLWLDEADLYLKAAADAGLTRKIEFAKVPAKERPDAELLARTEGVLAWSLPSGIIPSMPKLRWIQTQSAGVEGWLARPDLDPADRPDLRARRPHGADAGQHHRRHLLRGQAVRSGPPAAGSSARGSG